MNILAWNIRGVANDATIRTLKELRRQHKPDITLLFETRCSGARALEKLMVSRVAYGSCGRIAI
ncbi:hypothetical protein Ahy_A07g032475 [Arachis hypogaea]|uniref:Endonuclease/exonuclease/phosphatase domain-containing protein n=1 Tax=Arachis hypogaea TaxID=3818 RepID=A0A445C6Y9_ARAHY|nr:hypothetical protein Ahy_A07g032475 [Arachis hypogaea]